MNAVIRRCVHATASAVLLLAASHTQSNATSPIKGKPTTATIVTALANALGGMPNIKKIQTLYFEFNELSVHALPAGDIQPVQARLHLVGREWLTAAGDDRTESRSTGALAPPFLQVFQAGNSPQGWVLIGDQGVPSGNSTGALQGPDLTREISHVYWTTFAYLTTSGIPGTVKYKPTGGFDYLLVMTPKGGEPIDAYLDGKTFLPVKVQIEDGSYNMVLEPKDWKLVDGVRFPFDLTVQIVDAQLTLHYTFTKIALNVTPPKGAFTQPTPAI
ncbi:MAG: LolA-like protein [Vulcanimicrobiaceae bacterium]